MKISCIQTDITENKEKNIMKAVDLIKQSRGEIVCLPELFSTGIKKNARDFEEDDSGETYKILREISEEKKILLLGSYTEKNESEKPYNTVVAFNKGVFAGKYRKIHLFAHAGENLIYSPGEKTLVFDFTGTERIRIGIIICYDLRFPELARIMAKNKPDIIFIPANFPKTRKDHWKKLIMARAIENLCFTSGVNRTGKGENEYFGGSITVDPWGEIISEADEKEGILESEINLGKLREIREKYKFLDDIKLI